MGTEADRRLRWLAVGGLLAPVTLGGATIVVGALVPGTSHARQFISELGASGAAHAWILNVFGLMATGVLLVAFSLAVRRALGPGLGVAAGAACLGAMGFALVSAGAYSCDPGCPETGWSSEAAIHAWSGLVASLCAGLAPLAVGLGLSRSPLRGYARFSIGSGIVILGLIAVMVAAGTESPWRGAWQRGFLVVFFVWTIVTGAGIASAAAEPARA